MLCLHSLFDESFFAGDMLTEKEIGMGFTRVQSYTRMVVSNVLPDYRKTSNKRPRRLLEHGPQNPGV